MNQKTLSRIAGLTVVVLTASQLLNAAEASGDKPNLVLFMSDDHGAADSGAYGDGAVRTPNIDRLAGQAMRFSRAFAASPLCTPSRVVVHTGLMPFRNGGHKFGTPITPGIKTMPDYLRDLGYRVVLAGKTHLLPREQFPYEYVPSASAAAEILASHDRTVPLLLVVATHPPHMPWIHNTGYDPAEVELPPYFVDTPQTRRARTDYYSDVELMDGILGQTLDALQEHGYRDNTLVVYTSDQGANWPHGKWNLYDAGIRVPLLVRWPGKIEPGSASGAMVSLVDLLPTFIEAAGGSRPKGLDGRSLLPLVTGRTTEHHGAIFATHTGNDNGGPGIANRCPMRAIRTATHKYILNLHPEREFNTHITGTRPGNIFYLDYWDSWVEQAKTDPAAAKLVNDYLHRPGEELYDLTNDPHELNNIADDPKNRELLESLRKQLADWRREQGEEMP